MYLSRNGLLLEKETKGMARILVTKGAIGQKDQ